MPWHWRIFLYWITPSHLRKALLVSIPKLLRMLRSLLSVTKYIIKLSRNELYVSLVTEPESRRKIYHSRTRELIRCYVCITTRKNLVDSKRLADTLSIFDYSHIVIRSLEKPNEFSFISLHKGLEAPIRIDIRKNVHQSEVPLIRSLVLGGGKCYKL